MKTAFLALGGLLFVTPLAGAQQAARANLCERGSTTGRTVSGKYGQFTVTVTEPRSDIEYCSFRVLSPAGDELVRDDYMEYVAQPEYLDLDDDKLPELIVVAGSRGSGGFADSYIFSEPQVRGVIAITQACPVQVWNGSAGRALVTCDLEFASFDWLCNACSPRPAVYVRLEQGQLRDRSSLFTREYDAHIAEVRKQLKDGDLQALLKSRNANDKAFETSKARPLVLSIIVDYVYSGREPQARQTVETMWPAWDRERVWNDIVNTRSVGLLEQLQR